MFWGTAATRSLDDGLGVRRIEMNARDGGNVEVLEVSRSLATETFASAVRARAAQFTGVSLEGLAKVRRIEHDGQSLRIVADHVDGLRLPDLLHECVKVNAPMPLAAALELGRQVIRAVTALHQVPGGLAHGSISPAHVVVTRDARVVVTDALFGPAFDSMQLNREQLWREYRIAMPPSASLPRFDQRADVAQLGATVLAIALGRLLRADEYPKPAGDVVLAATLAAKPGETGTPASGLRMWLQQALYLHPRSNFASAIDAERAFAEITSGPANRAGATALQAALQRIFGDTPESAAAAQMAAAWSTPNVVHPSPRTTPHVDSVLHHPEPPSREDTERSLQSLFRSVFSNLRAN